MAKLLIEIAEESPCNFCGAPVPLDVTAEEDAASCQSCDQSVYPRYTAAAVFTSMLDGKIIDARQGGLVLGRDTAEDDIPMIAAVAPGVYQVLGLMHGGEYILSRDAAAEHSERVNEINSYKAKDYEPLRNVVLSKVTRMFNTNHEPAGVVALLIDHGQFIINRAGTAKFYQELENLNTPG